MTKSRLQHEVDETLRGLLLTAVKINLKLFDLLYFRFVCSEPGGVDVKNFYQNVININ